MCRHLFLIKIYSVELSRYGQFTSGIKIIPLGCKYESLLHVLPFRLQVFVFERPDIKLVFCLVYEGKLYMLYVNSGEMCCFECASVGHVRLSCSTTTTTNRSK